MAKKRKSDLTALDEVDRNMYTTFCSAANSLSLLYTQAMNQQKLSFQTGERHAQEKLYQWILRRLEEGSRVTNIDIISYLQNELAYGAEESHVPPQLPSQHQPHNQTAAQLGNSNWVGPIAFGLGYRAGQDSDNQPKNSSVFSNALSSPVRHSLQHYHLGQGSDNPNRVQGNDPNSNDSSMDMHSDTPSNDYP